MALVEEDQTIAELVQFLSSPRTDLRAASLEFALDLSGTPEGRSLLCSRPAAVDALVRLSGDTVVVVARNALCCLVNLSGDERWSGTIVDELCSRGTARSLLGQLLRPDCEPAEPIAMLFTNLSRSPEGADAIVKLLTADGADVTIDGLVQALCTKGYNKRASLDHIAPFLGNLTQSAAARAHFLDKERGIVRRLLPFTYGNYSTVRRRGVVTVLKNCCFETEHHAWLLATEVDILTALLLPLAGPEELPDDDMEKLPPDLQYLEPTKQREPEADIRKMLVEALNQLCATKIGRAVMRKYNVYVIIREYHKWEHERARGNEPAIYNLIDILIGDEPKEEHANLRDVVIPPEVHDALDSAAATESLLS